MEGFFEIFAYDFGIRALQASVLVGLMCGVLGCFIVLRNMSLIGDALAHAVLPGVVVGFVVAGAGVMAIFTGAVVAGLITAFFITWIQHNAKTKNDAAIGIVFTAMFSIGVMGISKVAKTGAHLDLDHFLFGNVLGLSDEDLYLTFFITLYVLVSVVVFYRYLFATTFQPVIAETMGISVKTVHYFLMLLLAFAVVVSLRAVGVILVVAMLITPASTALLLTDRLKWMLVISGFLGMLAAVLGLIFSNYYNTTPGPAMVIVATFFYLLAVFFSPKKGLLFNYFHKRKTRIRVESEDILKQSYRLTLKGNLSISSLKARLGMSESYLKRLTKSLRKKGWMEFNKNHLKLTKNGENEAIRLVRAHRLWETYLVEELGLSSEQIHEEAEKYEHILTEDILDEVETKLHFPVLDPHGSPIPQKERNPEFPLANLNQKEIAQIAEDQINDYLLSTLWKLGLYPEQDFQVLDKQENLLLLMVEEETIAIPTSLARKVNVIQ